MLGKNMKIAREAVRRTISDGNALCLHLHQLPKEWDLKRQTLMFGEHTLHWVLLREPQDHAMLVSSLIFFLVGFAGGVYAEKIYSALRIGAATTSCRKNLKNLMSRGYRQPCYVDNWNPQHHEFRKFKNLQDPHDAWSHEGVVWRNTGVQTNEGHWNTTWKVRILFMLHTTSWTVSETEK